ncbi:arylamine N-acetyltransferase [Nostoc sp. LEGE 06077]|uniref:arylamine N-acetyltransferase family protein n=1 Tax=Nostoc sp. LEGE 06077 TaxID=915325 RepID=UPI0018801482|nr:arylamine N-acetyltransferase [Nostoc sp. LEGE 06077]MBE9206594.1 arylamine N-acetyltransferase [Nostoc sp. LEGE 06077]
MEQLSNTINLDGYFQRIGYKGDRSATLKTLQAIHLHHTKSIAFENLNSLLKQPVSLNLQSLEKKLIYEGRGGYCFEQNLLLRSVLLALGFKVKNLAARVLWNVPAGIITPRTHMLLWVEIDELKYIADVGFGGITLTAPLSVIPEITQTTPHESFRLIMVDHTYILQAYISQEWKSLYYFDLQEQQIADYEVSSWYVSTHPNSIFISTLMVARADENCRYTLLNNKLRIHHLDGGTESRVLKTVADLRTTLEEVFCLTLPEISSLDDTLSQFVE